MSFNKDAAIIIIGINLAAAEAAFFMAYNTDDSLVNISMNIAGVSMLLLVATKVFEWWRYG